MEIDILSRLENAKAQRFPTLSIFLGRKKIKDLQQKLCAYFFATNAQIKRKN